MDQLYREVILENWRNPQNFGEIENPSFHVSRNNSYCGDSISFSGTIKKGELQDVAFQGKGCAISIASASIFSEFIKGMPVKDILSISQEEYHKIIGMEMGATRIKCSLFVYSTLMTALTSVNL